VEVSFDQGWRFFRGDPGGAYVPEFADEEWRKLDVPHDWRIEDLPYATSNDGVASDDPSAFAFTTRPSPDGNPPAVIGPFNAHADPNPNTDVSGGRTQGYTVGDVAWYRKHFTVSGLTGGGRDKRVELRFDGVFQDVDVWLGGRHLGFHPNGYTSFAYDLTPYLNRSGENVLAVRVDNSGETCRWYSGSGIYRHTWLTVTGPVRIPLWGVNVATPVIRRDRASVRVVVQVQSFAERISARVRVSILDLRGRQVTARTTRAASIASHSAWSFTVELAVERPALWSPDSPSMYQVVAEVLVDSTAVDAVTVPFGIRSLSWGAADGFRLNGEQIKIAGANIHQNHGPLGAVALDRAGERTIELLKDAGFNAIRTAHNPPAPAVLDACDRLGMLVWEEFSDMWDIAKTKDDYSRYFPQWWRRDLTSMIQRDRNHPSVIIWSLGNEIEADPHGYGPRMAALVRSLDDARPVTVGGDSVPYAEVADVHYGNAVNGNSSIATAHSTYPTSAVTQSEGFPTTVYDDWRLVQENSWLAGSWVWSGWDYLGEAGAGATPVASNTAAATAAAHAAAFGAIPYPWFQAFCGDIDLIGQRKPQSYWRAVVRGLSSIEMMVERPTPPGTSQYAALWGYYDELPSWTWDVPHGQPLTIHVYTSGDSVQLLLNSAVVASHSLTAADKRATTFTVPYAPGTLTAIASRNGNEIGRRTLTTTGTPAALRLSSDLASLTTSRDDLAHVLVETIDEHGRLAPDAVIRVAFEITGAGELFGTASGNPHNVDSFKHPEHYTWHGQALAIVRPAKTQGTVQLKATAPGLRAAILTLPVKRQG
jgi:beta-galactosidase